MSIARTPRRRMATGLAMILAALAIAVGSTPTAAHADRVRDGAWQLRDLDVATAWRYATGAGVIVAVLDSGVDASHPDLAGQVLPGVDLVDGPGLATSNAARPAEIADGRRDPVGHGTTVAALIAGRADDASGVAGIAPRARILPVRVLDDHNHYDDPGTVAGGLRWAVDHGARVVNLSLGGPVRSEVLADALQYAASRDVVVVACTGNVSADAPGTEVWYPAREPGVVAVAGLVSGSADPGRPDAADADADGTDAGGPDAGGSGSSGADPGAPEDTLWSGSLTGSPTVLTAPAVDLLGARPGGYWRVRGTSFAAPLVAGTAALIRSRWPTMDAANVINRLILTARDLGPAGHDHEYGYGEVDPVAALTATVAPVQHNPLAAPGGDAMAAAAQEGPAGPAGPAEVRADAPAAPRRLMVGGGALAFAVLFSLGAALVRSR